jgi:cell division protein FtsB
MILFFFIIHQIKTEQKIANMRAELEKLANEKILEEQQLADLQQEEDDAIMLEQIKQRQLARANR